MAEYIERSAVLQNKTTMTEYDEGGWDAPVSVVRVEDIEAIPAADVVPVVRCKDCMWSRQVDDKEPKYLCVHLNRDHCTQWLDSNDFCSYGERRSDDG